MKDALHIKQTSQNIRMDLKLAEEYIIHSVFLLNHQTEELKVYASANPGPEYHFEMPIESFLNELKKEKTAEEILAENTVENAVEQYETTKAKTGLWYWYAAVELDQSKASDELIEKGRESAAARDPESMTQWKEEDSRIIRNLRIGKFKQTAVDGLGIVADSGHTMLTYLNTFGYVVTAVDEKTSVKVKLQIEKLKTGKNTVNVEGRINTGFFPLVNCKAVLKSRTTVNEYFFDIRLNRNEETFTNKYGKNIYLFELEIPFDHLLPYKEDVYDLFLEGNMAFSMEPVRMRVGRPTMRAKYLFSELSGESEQEILLINPYYTLYKSNLSFEVFPFKAENYKYLKKMRRFTRLRQLMNRGKNVWLVGERPYKAQDTGYHFFKYMRQQHPEKNVYYVISKDSTEYDNVAFLGNVLEFGSKEHIKNAVIATKIFSSHHANYLFPLRTKSFDKLVKATRIFLQHGVMGVKNMTNLYGVTSSSFKADLFIVSSEYEKEYISSDFGYKKEDIAVTGLARYDALFKKDTAVKKQVLIIPTWRDWIQNIESFLESEYYFRYNSLINNTELQRHAQDHGYELVFCLHPNMQAFSSYFENSPVKVIYQGDVDVQQLIKESALLVTDYSSVAFDFSFLHKPVIYYQFDRTKFIGPKGSHLDLLNDLPGKITEEETELVEELKKTVDNGFVMEELYKEKANRFIAYRDELSSQRIYEAALVYEKKKEFLSSLKESEFAMDLFKKFRRSKYYFPVMKKAYTVMRFVLPVNKKKAFFESGIGKNFSDSPKEIFDVLQAEKRDLEYIWSYNRKVNQSYDNTRIIERLSPAYYYHLATSRYWINNQNFPTYIKKRRSTSYLQTWHGTPLKRMLHDIEEIQGRDETYLERVSSAVKSWDYLLSPSRYATESFKSAFRYAGPVIEEGYPRNDIFYRENSASQAQELKERLKIDPDKKVILYAMTFRDNQTAGNKFTIDLPIDFEKFHERLGDEYVLLIRLHVVISSKLKIPAEYKESIINVSSYPDIQELMLISDALVTDYSSVFFDFLNTDKPILFYTYDLEEYRDKLRGFYIDFEKDAPGPLCLTEDALYDSMAELDAVKETYQGKYNEAKRKFTYLDDGQASKRVIEKFFK